ncbi:MAG: hypothetical protein P4L51_04645, partial [Puia sp.]|nr:hypothetical protein [Puia sp.]
DDSGDPWDPSALPLGHPFLSKNMTSQPEALPGEIELRGRRKQLIGKSSIPVPTGLNEPDPISEHAIGSGLSIQKNNRWCLSFPDCKGKQKFVKKSMGTTGANIEDMRSSYQKRWGYDPGRDLVVIPDVYDRATKTRITVKVPTNPELRHIWTLLIYIFIQKAKPFERILKELLWDLECDTAGYSQQELLDYLSYFVTVQMSCHQRRALEEEWKQQNNFFNAQVIRMALPEVIENALRLYNLRRLAESSGVVSSRGPLPNDPITEVITSDKPYVYRPRRPKLQKSITVQVQVADDSVADLRSDQRIISQASKAVGADSDPEDSVGVICFNSDIEQNS